jgi:16S rRNA (cytosine967-C5)-methyltransferase
MAENASPARGASWAMLRRLPRAAETPLPVLLEEQRRSLGLSEQDAGLTRELVYGILRCEGRLRALLRPFLPRPEELPRPLALLLLLGAYELLFLDRVPVYATLHQTTGMARRRYGSAFAGLANAVLRNVAREKERLLAVDAAFLEAGGERPPGDVARMGNLPDWLARLWIGQYGWEAAWSHARNAGSRPCPSYRLNLARPDSPAARRSLLDAGLLEDATASGLWLPAAGGSARLLPDSLLPNALLENGRVSRQGLTPQVLAEYLANTILNNPRLAKAPLWDACCGRGGKTCALLERGVNVSLASDPHAQRLQGLRDNLRRLSLPFPEIIRAGAEEIGAGHPEAFPLILLDVPCSGTGTLARTPELRLRIGPQRIAEQAEIQADLLRQAWRALAPGGMLFYATCALARDENEEQAARFREKTPAASLADMRPLPPPLPGQDHLFLAVLEKRQ